MSLVNNASSRRQSRLVSSLVVGLTLALAGASQAQPSPPAPDPGEPPLDGGERAPDAAPAPAEAAPGAGEPAPDEEAPAAGAEQEPEEAEVDELGQIVITARRRRETAQDVPVAVDVLGGDALEAKGSVGLQQFHREVASVQAYSLNPRNVTINIRGIGTGIAATGNGLDSGVGFYVDDIYYGRIGQSILNLVDVERIEVLKGPQGTLFGRNTTAGALSVVTREPSFSPDGLGELTVGNYKLLSARGTLSGPIIADKLAARVSFEALYRDGYLRNTHQHGSNHDMQSTTVRAQLLYKPTEKLKLRLIGDYARSQQICCIFGVTLGYITQFDNGAPIPYNYAQRYAELGRPVETPDPGSRTVDASRLRPFRVTIGGASLRADWDFSPAASLTSISSFRFWNNWPRNDNDGLRPELTVEGNQDDTQRQVSQEVRIASTGESAIDWVGGLFFFWQSVDTRTRNEYSREAGLFYIPPSSGLTREQRIEALNGALFMSPFNASTLSAAAFGQATWHIVQALDFTGGVRYTWERKTGWYEAIAGSRIDTSHFTDEQLAFRAARAPNVPRFDLEKNWGDVSGLATLSAKPSDDALIYGTYSRGSKSGGLNVNNLPPEVLALGRAILKPEIVDHFEVGFKSQWFDNRLTFNTAAFFTEIRDYQNNITDNSLTPLRLYLSNVGKVRSKGIEAELRVVPTKGLSLRGQGTWNIAEYTSYKNAQCPYEKRAPGVSVTCDLSGQQLPVAPKYAVSAGGDYSVPLSESLEGFVGADYSYRSSYTTSTNNSRYSRIDRVDLVNGRVGLKAADGRWAFTVWSNNLFDKLFYYAKGVDEQAGGLYTGYLGEPRTYGATLRYYFY